MKAAIVGSGPNGLAAGITLARNGYDVTVYESAATPGGGMRSNESLRSGVVHDMCSAVHPMSVVSPFFRETDLAKHGLRFAFPEVDLAHPLDGGRAGVLYRDIERTSAGLGSDGRLWKATFGPMAANFDKIGSSVFGPMLTIPKYPLSFGYFGMNAALPAQLSAKRWRSDEAQALYIGVAAHNLTRLDTPMSSAAGTLLTAAAHVAGWPVAEGGSGSIAAAMVAELEELGGKVECDHEVTSLKELRNVDAVMLDVSPSIALKICGDELPARQRRAYRNFRHGVGAFKVDFVIKGKVPWTNAEARKAGTVHVGGTADEVARAEKAAAAGGLSDRPFILVGQQYLADPSRSSGDYNPLWAYAHVPAGYRGDATEAIVTQIERFAPGFRDIIVESVSYSTEAVQDYNANYIGGDIIGGSSDMIQLLARPIFAPDPYFTGIDGVYLCSASTPPGAGVHGMSGWQAASRAIKARRT
ncbi:Phytoene dehydrogenase-related protein [Corynebacterium mycetoides]|uniref:Phytoene dehydrogenase-related protein n=1 Tax=Corynebacterium mycetoides TaxID=38302 RepID=A0A1G9L4T8_9CORY|nr:NAD(P)/FAD-dependent oxidoreductase [Corynebacterium mycetoides]SDL56990.1 Phytoene dehydrogenase-related protein [Corynebacterium mycetoides]SDM16484.1 Phytoene dehydrogenase-related protein [Corynebacterium mycetoides]